MNKRLLLLIGAVCILLVVGLTACVGNKSNEIDNEETQTLTVSGDSGESGNSSGNLSPEQMNDQMIGVWIPAEGLQNDIYKFGYMSDSGFTSDSGGQLCIQADYVKDEGGGSTSVDYEYTNGKLVYTTYISSYSAGGEISSDGVITVENLQGDKATINGVAYEKVTDDPSDPDRRTDKIFKQRFTPLVVGEWEGVEGMVYLKLNEDGTMRYEDTSMGVDGTWEGRIGMDIEKTIKQVVMK